MKFRAVASCFALCAFGLSMTATVASAAELGLAPAHRVARVQTGYVFWDNVYPPAIYGPQLRPVDEVAAMKATAAPVTARWNGYWYR